MSPAAAAAPTEAPIDRVIRALVDQDVKPAGTGQWIARCPAHEDRTASLSVGTGAGGRALLHCHAGCKPEDVVAAAGIELKDLMPEAEEKRAKKIVATYAYADEKGLPLYQVVRYDPKVFRLRRRGASGWLYNLNGVRRVPYNLPAVMAAKADATVFVVEGEKDADNLVKLGLVATTSAGGAGGAGQWMLEKKFCQPLRGRRVVILPDADEPGKKYAAAVASALKGIAADVRVVELPGLPEKGDVSDWIAAGGTAEALIALVKVSGVVKTTGASLTRMSDVEAQEVSWLWPGRIPAGMISVLDGPPKVGKSSVVIDLVARITTGSAWPVGAGKREPADVILIGHEDSAAHTIRPRLDAAGADPARVRLLTEIHGRLPELPTDVDEIEKVIVETRSVLVVFDPISAYLAGADLHRDNDVRAALAPLAGVAERTGAAILFLRHLRKSGGVDAISRGLGSVAIGALARCMMMVLADPDDDEAKLLTWPAINVAAQPKSIRWRFDRAPNGKPPRIAWDDAACDLTADEVLDHQDDRQRQPGALERACAWLRQQLADGRVPSAELERRAIAAGHTERTLRRARKEVGIQAAPKGHRGPWYAELPSKAANEPPSAGVGQVGQVGQLEMGKDGQPGQEGQEAALEGVGRLGQQADPEVFS